MEVFQKQGFTDAVQNRFLKFKRILIKTPMLESLFKKVSDSGACNFILKILHYRCFPVNFVMFLGTPFLQNIFGRLPLVFQSRLVFLQIKTFQTTLFQLNMKISPISLRLTWKQKSLKKADLVTFAVWSTADQLRIWSHLLKKSLMENFIFCAVNIL